MPKKRYRSRVRCVCCGKPADAFTVDDDPYCAACFASAVNVRWFAAFDNDFYSSADDDVGVLLND